MKNLEKNSVLSLIGKTPIVKIDEINNTNIYAKLEYYNPTGSIKDRAVYSIISNAIRQGKLKQNDTIVEATSGNTGISIAMVAKQYGMNALLIMPASMSAERISIMKSFGAKLILVKEGGIKECERQAVELSKQENYFHLNQFKSKYNEKAHYKNTAPEIFKQLPNVDCIIAGFGTSGTIMGIQKYINKKRKNTIVIAVEPKESPLITEGVSGPHKIQGLGANFVPKLLDKNIINSFETVSSQDAIDATKKLINNYSIMSGISGGASFAKALEVAKRGNYKEILFIIPDHSSRYQSIGIYEE